MSILVKFIQNRIKEELFINKIVFKSPQYKKLWQDLASLLIEYYYFLNFNLNANLSLNLA